MPERPKEAVTKQRTNRHSPIRTCIGCRTTASSAQLLRCVATANGAAVSRTLPGRGAWLCSTRCLQTARKRKAFNRAWRRSVDERALDALTISFEAAVTGMTDLSAPGATRAQTPTKG